MKDGICPNCKSSQVYNSDFIPLQAGEGRLGLYNPKGTNFQMQVFLCVNCGHIEFGVEEKSLGKLAELVKSDKWKKVG